MINVVRHARLATMQAAQALPGEGPLALIEDGAIVTRSGHIAWLGPDLDLPAEFHGIPCIDAGGALVTPGLVDCHTHLCFDGERSGEFERRCAGESYLEIAKSGGGILSTVRATRAASDERLAALLESRLARLAAWGVTTCEVKSGYALDVAGERRLLRVIAGAGAESRLHVIPTLLMLHALPPERHADRAAFVAEAAALAADRAAPACDAFVESSAFTADEARIVFDSAKAAGARLRLHVDQLTAGRGAQLAALLGAASADHLEQIDADGIAALGRSATVAVLLPTATWFIRERRYAPGRALIAAGATVAVATNANPGSAMTENLGLAFTLACLENGLSPAQALWGFTRGGAAALGLVDRGVLAVGARADLAAFGCRDAAHLAWHAATTHCTWRMVGGALSPHTGVRCE